MSFLSVPLVTLLDYFLCALHLHHQLKHTTNQNPINCHEVQQFHGLNVPWLLLAIFSWQLCKPGITLLKNNGASGVVNYPFGIKGQPQWAVASVEKPTHFGCWPAASGATFCFQKEEIIGKKSSLLLFHILKGKQCSVLEEEEHRHLRGPLRVMIWSF